MSLFAGVLRLDGAPVEAAEVMAMMSAAPPGPFARPPARLWADGPLAMAHRLEPMTPEDAFEQQPLEGEDAVLMLAGRIDNRADLIAGLAPAVRPAPCDSALAAAAWAKWGEACTDHLEGDFSLVVWDRRRRRLFAAVDAMGRRGFFFHHRHPWFLFASAPLAVLAHPQAPRRLSETTLAGYLAIHRPFAGETYFDGIDALPAAHALSVADGRRRQWRYWDFPPAESLRLPRDEDYCDRLLELLHQSVSAQLRSASPVGATLSGGLDSSSIVWAAATQLGARGERLATYTAVPPASFAEPPLPGWYNDETSLVLAQAERLGNLDPRFVDNRGATPLDGLDRWFDAAAMPMHATWNRTWMETLLSQAAGEGRRVMLTGQTGNSTLSWPGTPDLPRLFVRGRWLALWRHSAGLAGPGGRPLSVFLRRGAEPTLPTALRRLLSGRTGPYNSALNPNARHLVGPARSRVWTIRRLGIAAFSEPYESGMQALTGVELRDPTRDRRLAEFCLALPLDQSLRDGVSRRLVRRTMAGRLPPAVLENRLRGMQAADWARQLEGMRPNLLERLEAIAAEPLARDLIDLPLLRSAVERWPEPSEWNSRDVVKLYNGALGRGLMAGEFILWFQRRRR